MKLIVGGAGNGKLAYVLESTGFSEAEVARDFESAGAMAIFYGVQSAIKAALEQGADPNLLMDSVLEQNPGVIVICDEVGSGVVPAVPEERRYREAVGRFCCRAARVADEVERVICGIPTVLKGDGQW